MKKFLALALAVTLVAGMLTAMATTQDEQLTITVKEGEAYVFSAEDISVTLEEGRTLRGIIITGLPENGVLSYSGRQLYAGEGILASGLDALSYTGDGRDTEFTFLAVYYDGTARDSTTIRLRARGAENTAPVAEDMSLETYKGVARTMAFAVTDAEGDQLTYQITDEPDKGAVAINGDGTFTYTPDANKVGRDTFIYTASDPSGDTTREALVTITIARRAPKVAYGDMDGSTVSYEAARLAEEGVFVGEQVNGRYVFSPDKEVNRGEFLAMALKASGLDTMSVSSTGFADDGATASWQKDYIATAQLTGVVKGLETDDGNVFQAGRAVTGREAGQIVSGLMGFEATGAIETAALEENWAVASVMALEEANFLDGSCFGEETLTRAQAASILVAIMDYQ